MKIGRPPRSHLDGREESQRSPAPFTKIFQGNRNEHATPKELERVTIFQLLDKYVFLWEYNIVYISRCCTLTSLYGNIMGCIRRLITDISAELARYEAKGFSRNLAEVNVAMELAAFGIFRDFPDAFLIVGGACLVLYHDSLRHSADLDLLVCGATLPSHEEVVTSLKRELRLLAEVLGLGELRYDIVAKGETGTVFVAKQNGESLFRVDLTRQGPAIESEIEEHRVEGDLGAAAVIRSASKDLLLLQKAEAFLQRRHVKARDAYDIGVLQRCGAVLGVNLQAHLQDTILGNKFDEEFISGRIEEVNDKLCRLELKPILPKVIYSMLEGASFLPLRESLKQVYEEWL